MEAGSGPAAVVVSITTYVHCLVPSLGMWDVVWCKSKHHPECVVLPTTLSGNVVPIVPRYFCRGQSLDNSNLYLADTGCKKKGTLFQVTQAGDSFEIALTRILVSISGHVCSFIILYYL